MEQSVVEIIGMLAAVLTTAAFIPQVYKTWKTKDVESLSFPMLAMFFTGVSLWLVYGIYLSSPSLIFANSVTVVSAFFLIYFKIKYRNK
ncbi:MAG: SemiSWEET family sugar transporter [bacterium]